VLIDPGEEPDLFLRRLAHENLALKAVWLTHGHLDHVDGVKRIVEETGAVVYLHPDDRKLYDNTGPQGAAIGVRSVAGQPAPDRELAHGDELSVGECSFAVRHVPGHSKGGVAFVGHGVVFSGDALFMGSIGRTDLPGGDTETLLTSIQEQLLSLPDETVVYPGHGPDTTIGAERRTNPFLTGAYGKL
jgi:glyoxylase-like metal-dependent hydrolase (beta-lactamase superfamily II)